MDFMKCVLKPVDWTHWTIVVVVFSITGVLAMLLGRFLLRGILQLDGDFWSGPWSYRLAFLLLIPPVYSVTLLVVGTLLGKHAYFKRRVFCMWGYLLPGRIRSRIVGVKGQKRSNS